MKIGCIIMASGLSSRFGSNKLLAEFNGKSLISIILDKTTDIVEEYEYERLVLTRTKEVSEYCTEKGIRSVLHNLPERNDAVKLGIEQIGDCDACIFCTCDQPLLRKESIISVIDEFLKHGKGIYRLSYNNQAGNPILFTKEYFEELKGLPSKKGGAYLTAVYPEEVRYVSASDEWELKDADTKEDLEKMEAYLIKQG